MAVWCPSRKIIFTPIYDATLGLEIPPTLIARAELLFAAIH